MQSSNLYLLYQGCGTFETRNGADWCWGHSATADFARFDKAEDKALEMFSGFTHTEARGGWVSPEGKVYKEPSRVWHIYSDSYMKVVDFVFYLRELFAQDAIMVVRVQGEVEFL